MNATPVMLPLAPCTVSTASTSEVRPPAPGSDGHVTDPLGYIVRAYDRAIAACDAFDHAAARDAVALLRAGLVVDSPASRGFDALYAWCEGRIAAHDFNGAARTLRSLREAWCRAIAPPTGFSGTLPVC